MEGRRRVQGQSRIVDRVRVRVGWGRRDRGSVAVPGLRGWGIDCWGENPVLGCIAF